MLRRIPLGWFLIFVMALILTACGGGGGGGSTGGPDTTAPTVSSVTPANGATGVATTATISIAFSEAMDAATISTATISVDNGVSGTVAYDAASHVATFTPAGPLANNTVYTVTVATGVKDLAGNPLATASTSSFTTTTLSRQFGTTTEDSASAVAVDGSGNVYVVGTTGRSLDGQAYSGGNSDLFLVKYDRAGIRQWTRLLGTAGTDSATDVALDAAGNIFVVGSTTGSFPGYALQGNYDAFLAKYGADGTLQWVRQFGTPGDDFAERVLVNTAGVYVVGDTTGILGASSAGGSDGFVVKFPITVSGTTAPDWSTQFGTAAEETVNSAAFDTVGNVVVVGQTSGSFGAANQGLKDVFVATRSGTDGSAVATQQFGTPATDEPDAVAVDSSGRIFVAGTTLGAFGSAVNAGTWDFFLARLDSGITVVQGGSAGYDYANGLVVTSGHVYLSGFTSGVLGSASSGGEDAFLADYNPDTLNPQGIVQYGTAGDDRPFRLALDAANSLLYLPGQTTGALPGFSNAGGADAMLLVFGTNLTRR